jgi:hypothetical protein
VVGSELRDSVDAFSAGAGILAGTRSTSSFLDVLDYHLGAGGAHFSDFVRLGVVAESASVGHSLHHYFVVII